jgi:energy-converting hydrogenase Eha subunit H
MRRNPNSGNICLDQPILDCSFHSGLVMSFPVFCGADLCLPAHCSVFVIRVMWLQLEASEALVIKRSSVSPPCLVVA